MKVIQTILYSFRRCPYAMRARMALVYARVDYQHREILLKHKPQSMLDYSPKGTVPVLVVNNKVLGESLDVMLWALEQSDTDDWLLNNKEALQQDMHNLIDMCDEKFKSQLDCYKYSDRHELTERQYRDRTLWFLEELNNRLKRHQYLITDMACLADFSIFPFIRQYAFVNKKWFDNNEYSHLQNWLEKHLKSELFQAIMYKHELWQEGKLDN